MLARLKTHLTYANVVATLALFAALGGSAYAAAKITSKQVKNRSLRGIDIKRNTLTGKEIREGSLGQVKKAGTAVTALSATNAQSANAAETAKTAGNSQALDGLASGVFERSSRTQFGSATGSPATPADEGLLLQSDALGFRMTAPAQGGCSNALSVTLRVTNTNTSGPDVHLYGGASGDTSISSGGSTIACSVDDPGARRRWTGAISRDGTTQTLFFNCWRLSGDVRCIATRSEP